MERGMKKRGQLALFVIIAIAIVAIILLFVLRPSVAPLFGKELAPYSFMQSCIGKDLNPVLKQLGENAGYESLNVEGYALYQGEKYKYLCYTNEDYKTCTIQQPMIISNFNKELTRIMKARAENCVLQMKSAYEDDGWSVQVPRGSFSASVDVKAIEMKFDGGFSAVKGEQTQKYTDFTLRIPSGYYELMSIASSIVDFEATYGDSETTLYLQYYPDLSINKIKLSDSTTIYILKNVVSGEEFRFASRSLIWPAGYGG